MRPILDEGNDNNPFNIVNMKMKYNDIKCITIILYWILPYWTLLWYRMKYNEYYIKDYNNIEYNRLYYINST